MIYLDTHVVAWLYDGDLRRFSKNARITMEREPLLVSPIVQLELSYLKEIGRIMVDGLLIIETLGQSIGLRVCDLAFNRVVVESLHHAWTRDPFDRLIVGHAQSENARLLTKDRIIRKHYKNAFW